jgi:hypothetical protein
MPQLFLEVVMPKTTRISKRDHEIVSALFEDIQDAIQQALYETSDEDDPQEQLEEDIKDIVFKALQMKRQKTVAAK